MVLRSTTIWMVLCFAASCNSELVDCEQSLQSNCITNDEFVAGANAAGGNVRVQGALDAPIPAGFYDGTTRVVIDDTNLVAGNIRSGAKVFGIDGTFTPATLDACVDNALNPSACSTASSRFVTSLAGNNRSAVNGALTVLIPSGFYAGSETVSFSDISLVATNICSTASIFSMPGSAICQGPSGGSAALSSHVLAGTYYWPSNGMSTAGTMVNRAALDAAASFPGAGYYNGTTTNVPPAGRMCDGTTALGVTGNAPCVAAPLLSNALRDKATAAFTQQDETSIYGGANLPTGYRTIPDILVDDDGTTGGSVTYAPRPSINCGTTQPTIAARIADCNTTWNGATQGNGGYAIWSLVTRAAANKEVWRDERTGLLWSSELAYDNWCKASGNAQSNDPDNFCNNVTYQPGFGTTPWSYCEELGTVAALAADAVGTTAGNAWNTVYSNEKGRMGAQSAPVVRWRLPTRPDFQQADIDGLRFVIPTMGSFGDQFNPYEWTSTIATSPTSSAWIFLQNQGGSSNGMSRQFPGHIRCVGR